MILQAENLLSGTSLGVFVAKLAAYQEQRCAQLLSLGDKVVCTACGQVLIFEQDGLLEYFVAQFARQTKEVEEPRLMWRIQ